MAVPTIGEVAAVKAVAGPIHPLAIVEFGAILTLIAKLTVRTLGHVEAVLAVKTVVEVAAMFASGRVKTQVTIQGIMNVVSKIAILRMTHVRRPHGIAFDKLGKRSVVFFHRPDKEFGNLFFVFLFRVLFIEYAVLFLLEMRAAEQIMAVVTIMTKGGVIEAGAVLRICAVVAFVKIHTLVEKLTVDGVVGVYAVGRPRAVKAIQAIGTVCAVETRVRVLGMVGMARIRAIFIVCAVRWCSGDTRDEPLVLGQKISKRHGIMGSFLSKYAS